MMWEDRRFVCYTDFTSGAAMVFVTVFIGGGEWRLGSLSRPTILSIPLCKPKCRI